MRQTKIFPSQNHNDIGGEALLRAVDVTHIDKPDGDGNLSRPGVSVWPVDERGCFRAAR
jgi:hypothetical protein